MRRTIQSPKSHGRLLTLDLGLWTLDSLCLFHEFQKTLVMIRFASSMLRSSRVYL